MKVREVKSRDRKPQFAHDENLEFALLRKKSNRYALFKPLIIIAKDKIPKGRGLKDPEAIELCDKKDYHLITHNTADFQNPKKGTKIGIICIGSRIDKNWVKLFNKLMTAYPNHGDLYWLNVLINNEIQIRNRKTGAKRKI